MTDDLLLGFAGALAVYQQEHAAPGATIRTFGDAAWSSSSWLLQVFSREDDKRPPGR